jgi:hypothetical protein
LVENEKFEAKRSENNFFFAWACKTDLDSLRFTLKLQSQKEEEGQGGEGYRLGGNLGLLTVQWTVIKLKIKF